MKKSRKIVQEFREHMHTKHLLFTDSVYAFFYTMGHGFNVIKNPPQESQHKTSTIAFEHIFVGIKPTYRISRITSPQNISLLC